MNILSIDWDYFVDADMDKRNDYFPDIANEDYNIEIQNTIWESRYAYCPIKNIGVADKVKTLMKCLRKTNCKVMVMRSHKYAYDFVKGLGDINLVNVDFHHDLYTHSMEDVNCGNWLCKVMDEHNGKYTWVACETSDKEIDQKYAHKITVTEDLDTILDYEWDMVFICRSDMWSPPHLDKEFLKIVNYVLKNAPQVKGDELIKKTRYDKYFERNVKELAKINKMYEQKMNKC